MNWHEYFTYDDGQLIWKERPRSHFNSKAAWCSFNARFSGKPAGYNHPDGYIRVRADGALYLSHRIIYEMFNGKFVGEIDHIDRNKSNNRIDNLRTATREQNTRNFPSRGAVQSKGVYYNKKKKKYISTIYFNGRNNYLGQFDDEVSAAEAYDLRAKEIHKEFFYKKSNVVNVK